MTDFLDFVNQIEKTRVFKYRFKNQDLFPDGTGRVLSFLRYYFGGAQVWSGGPGVIESVVAFTEAELGYLQAIHDFGDDSVFCALPMTEERGK